MARKRVLAVGIAFALSMSANLATAISAEAVTNSTSKIALSPGVAPSQKAADSAIYVDQSGKEISPAGANAGSPNVQIAAVGCTPGSGIDNPHISSKSINRAVQAHGTWTKGSCTANTAHVTVCLYEYYRNTSGTQGYWEQKNCTTEQIRPGGGSATVNGLLGRTTGHADCNTIERTDWRAHVDVDVDGQIDTGEQPYRQAPVDCRVY